MTDIVKEYDFTVGERGKFYRPNAKLELPVYLEKDVAEFIQEYARQKNIDTNQVVNDWLRNNIKLIQSLL